MENLKEKNILSLDSSSESGSIAYFKSGQCAGEISSENVGTHGEWLLENIDALICTKLGLSLNDVDAFVTTTGPGSFTGLRIGISVLKGLSWNSDRKIYGVSTLRALASNIEVSVDTLICPVLDARRGQIYGAIYKYNKEGNLDAIFEDCALSSDEFVRVIIACKEDNNVVFTGKGLNQYGDYFKENFEGFTQSAEEDWNIKASTVGELAIAGYCLEYNAECIKPLYLREDSPFKKVSAQVDNSDKQAV